MLWHLYGMKQEPKLVSMQEHYEFLFFEGPLRIEDVRLHPPTFCLHPLNNCHSSLLYKFRKAQMHRQRFFVKQFQAELLQLDSENPFSFRYRTDRNRLFILFCLQGEVRFTTIDGRRMTVARKGYFYVSRNSPGIYNVQCRKKGTTLVLAVSISPKWARRKVSDFPRLKEALSLLMESERQYGIMAHCEINDEVSVWLRYLQLFANSEKRSFGRMLKSLIGNALKYYEDLMENRSGEPIHSVKRHMDQNFRDPSLTVQRLSELFPIEERTLRKKFAMEFHTTPVSYLTMLRLREAKRLIEKMGFSISDVWHIVGYNDPETFRQAYIKLSNDNR